MHSEVRDIQYGKPGGQDLKNLGAPLATKLTYKKRSGGKGMWARGPTLYKHNFVQLPHKFETGIVLVAGRFFKN
jgi:hypothetical protein